MIDLGDLRCQGLVWLDPGKLTGWAMLDNQDGFHSGQEDFAGIDDLVNAWGRMFGVTLWLGWEMYIVTQGGGRSGDPAYSLEVIGAVKSACRRHLVHTLSPMPSAARKLGGDDKLKRVGWYTPGKRHANDAANHLLAYLLREGAITTTMKDQLFTDS